MISEHKHFIVGECVQLWDTHAGGTEDEFVGHGDLGIISEQTKQDQYIVAVPNRGLMTIHVDWLREPNLTFVKAAILNQ
jgi:hypothetical protein